MLELVIIGLVMILYFHAMLRIDQLQRRLDALTDPLGPTL